MTLAFKAKLLLKHLHKNNVESYSIYGSSRLCKVDLLNKNHSSIGSFSYGNSSVAFKNLTSARDRIDPLSLNFCKQIVAAIENEDYTVECNTLLNDIWFFMRTSFLDIKDLSWEKLAVELDLNDDLYGKLNMR